MFFSHVLEGQPDAVFGLTGAFQADERPHKVDLLVGIYKNNELQSELLPAVKKAKEEIVSSDLLADYLPLDGLHEFNERIGELAFGTCAWQQERGRIFSMQGVGGTGALRVGAEFLAQEVTGLVCIPDPTWPNHLSIFERSGFKVDTYPYYNKKLRAFDLKAMCAKLETLPEKTAVILHAQCHNPSGRDPNQEDWKVISGLMKRKKLLPFFDCAYQGFGKGLEEDVWSIRYFLEQGHEMLVAYSCSKNFSLYCQRVGALFVVNENGGVKVRVESQLKRVSRALYSNPPAHGARIAAAILSDKKLRTPWEKEVEAMRLRIATMREALIERLCAPGVDPDFRYLRGHIGFFMLLDLTKSDIQRLIEEFAIYLLGSGRISIAGINQHNISYIADSIIAVKSS